MAQNANEILTAILGVCIRISNKLEAGEKKTVGGTIADMLGTRRGSSVTTKGVKEGSDTLKELATMLDKIGKSKFNDKKINATAQALKGLFNVIVDIGKKKTAVNNAIKLFDSLGKSMEGMSRFIGQFSKFLLTLGASILMIAGSVYLAGRLLGAKGDAMGAAGVIGIIAGIVIGMAGLMFLLAQASKYVDPGIKTTENMGKALGFLSLGLIAFALTMRVLPEILGFGGNGAAAIGLSMLTILGIVGAMSGVFWLMGKFDKEIGKGTAVAGGIALGMALLSLGVLSVALTARLLTGLGNQTDKEGNKKYDQKTGFGRMMAAIGPGLGGFGIILAGGVGALMLLGVLMGTGVLALGVVGAVVVAAGMGALSLGVLAIMKTAEKIKIEDVKKNISGMVGGVLGGLVEGVSDGLMGENRAKGGIKNGLQNMFTFTKNAAMLTASIGLLMGISVALSMFAYALTAFANLKNMRVIESYDAKTGKPKFGPTVNVEGVGHTITTTISEFLIGLSQATTSITFRQARNIDRMAAALTGKNGMLSAIIQFADVLKTFAQFGPKGEIGYVEFVPTGKKDANGKPEYKQVPRTVKIDKVAENITMSFIKFASAMAKQAPNLGVDRQAGKDMLNFSEALLGSEARKIFGLTVGKPKPGMFSAIKMFAETLETFAKYGEKSEIPTFNADGTPGVGIPVEKVAANVIQMLTSFSKELGTKAVTEDFSVAKKNLGKFEDIIEAIGEIGAKMDPLANLTLNIGLLADNMTRLGLAMGKIDNTTLAELNTIANKSIAVSGTGAPFGSGVAGTAGGGPQTNVYNTTNVAGGTPAAQQQVDWNSIAISIGNQVAASLKNGTFQFIFDTTKTGGVMVFGK